jgi:protein-tyrosine phosphatase
MAEVLLRHRLGELAVDARVASAGLLRPGQRASDHGVDIVRGRGLDLTTHRSRAMTRDMLRAADLILAMAREHVREAVVLDPTLWPRTFTLKELVRRGELAGPRRAGEPLQEWLTRVGQGRRISDLTGASPDDDVADPYGGPRSAYERMVTEMDSLIDRLVTLVFAGAMAPQ